MTAIAVWVTGLGLVALAAVRVAVAARKQPAAVAAEVAPGQGE